MLRKKKNKPKNKENFPCFFILSKLGILKTKIHFGLENLEKFFDMI